MAVNKQVIPLTGEILNLDPSGCPVSCPACETTAITTVVKQKTTCWQNIAPCFWCCFTCCGGCNCLQKWKDPGDLNHYCSKCGCFLGRCQNPHDYGLPESTPMTQRR